MPKEVATTFFFSSESNPNVVYQTIQWTTGELSCDCKGWTRRNPPGGRTCRHVRLVQAGLGARHAVKVVEQSTPARRTPQRASEPVLAGPRRRFALED
jgi:hypothetical protein